MENQELEQVKDTPCQEQIQQPCAEPVAEPVEEREIIPIVESANALSAEQASDASAEPQMEQSGKEKEKTDLRTSILTTLHDLVFVLATMLTLLLLVFRVVIVSGPSMNATLVDGDYLLLLGNVFYTQPQQGDIIVASKESFKDGEPVIKRIIATEGQEVDIDFVAGIVYVDGIPLDEPYTLTPTNLQEGVSFPVIVEEGCVFVMGDNRNMSKDSRNPEIGMVDYREILGKAIFLIFPGKESEKMPPQFDRIGVIR